MANGKGKTNKRGKGKAPLQFRSEALAQALEKQDMAAVALALRNGNTVVAGDAAVTRFDDEQLGLVRFNSAGQPDPTFSGSNSITSCSADRFSARPFPDPRGQFSKRSG